MKNEYRAHLLYGLSISPFFAFPPPPTSGYLFSPCVSVWILYPLHCLIIIELPYHRKKQKWASLILVQLFFFFFNSSKTLKEAEIKVISLSLLVLWKTEIYSYQRSLHFQQINQKVWFGTWLSQISWMASVWAQGQDLHAGIRLGRHQNLFQSLKTFRQP